MINLKLFEFGANNGLRSNAGRTWLNKRGYVNLGKRLSDQQLDAIHVFGSLVRERGENAGAELLESRHIRHPKEKGVERLLA